MQSIVPAFIAGVAALTGNLLGGFAAVAACDGRARTASRCSLTTAVMDVNMHRFFHPGDFVGELIVVGIVVFIGYSLFRAGKREGSIKGYNVGRSRRRRR